MYAGVRLGRRGRTLGVTGGRLGLAEISRNGGPEKPEGNLGGHLGEKTLAGLMGFG